MKIVEDIYVVGGGNYGIGISASLDCNIYLIDGGTESALIDAGVDVLVVFPTDSYKWDKVIEAAHKKNIKVKYGR